MIKLKDMPIAQIVTIALTCISAALIVGGFFCPPMGKIDGSVLQACGILLAFTALWVAAEAFLERGADAKFSAGMGAANATVEIHTDDDSEEEDKK